MRFINIILLSMLLYSLSFAYQDYDIDGVEDEVDRCPNTPFDKLVDEWGCPQDDSYKGALTIKIGSDISIDEISDQVKSLSLFVNYSYLDWDVSLSNSNYTVFDTNTFSDSGDVYLSVGKLFKSDLLSTKVSLGTKRSTKDIDLNSDVYFGTAESDYFASVNFNYLLHKRQNAFLYYGYTLSGDSSKVDYKNRHSYSIGSGYAITNRLYSSLSYEYSDSVYADSDAYRAISWFSSYNFSNTYFTTFNYAHALDDFSYDQTFSIKLGAYFE